MCSVVCRRSCRGEPAAASPRGGLVLLIAWSIILTPRGVAWPGAGQPGPPPLTEEELARAKTQLTDPDRSPEDKVRAAGRICEREGGAEKRRLLEAVADEPRQHAAVRLVALAGLAWSARVEGDKTGPTPELSRCILQSIREVLRLDERFALDVAAQAIDSGWGCRQRDRADARELALEAAAHADGAVRTAAFRALRWCGTARDAEVARRALSNPRCREFEAAMQAVRHNQALARPLRDDLLEIARSRVLAIRVRIYALVAIPEPYEKAHLDTAVGLYAEAVRGERYDKMTLLRAIRAKTDPELAVPYVISCMHLPAGNNLKPLSARVEPLAVVYSYLRDKDPKVRETARKALPLKDIRRCLGPRYADMRRSLNSALDWWDRKLRHQALSVVSALAPQATDLLPDLIVLLGEDKNTQLRVLDTLRAFGAQGEPAFPAVKKLLLASRDPDVRIRAFHLFRDFAKPDFMVPVVGKLLEDENRDLRERALKRIIYQLGPRAAPLLPALRKLLRHPDTWTRRLAREAITKIEEKKPQ